MEEKLQVQEDELLYYLYFIETIGNTANSCRRASVEHARIPASWVSLHPSCSGWKGANAEMPMSAVYPVDRVNSCRSVALQSG